MPCLRVLTGTSLQSSELKDISHYVNTTRAHHLRSDLFEGEIVVNINGFIQPKSKERKDSEYFAREKKDGITWSLQVRGRFLQPFNADNILFGNVFERPLILPWGSNAVFAFMRLIDPTLEHDLMSSTKPWALSPLIATMPHFAHSRITQDAKYDDAQRVKADISEKSLFPPLQSIEDSTSELNLTLICFDLNSQLRHSNSSSSGSSHGFEIRESTASSSLYSSQSSSSQELVSGPWSGSTSSHRNAKGFKPFKRRGRSIDKVQSETFPPPTQAPTQKTRVLPNFGNSKERRSYFGSKEHRQQVEFGPKDIITVDFCYGFLEFNPTLALRLPGGLTFDLTKYWDGQPVRFVCCERKQSGSRAGIDDPWGRVFWCVSIEME